MLVRIKVSSGLVQHVPPPPFPVLIPSRPVYLYLELFIVPAPAPHPNPSIVISPLVLLPPYDANQVLRFSVLFKRFLIAVREPEGSSFARHINLQLTYSFQNNAQNPMHGMNGNKGSLYPAHGEPTQQQPSPPTHWGLPFKTKLISIFASFSLLRLVESSMDELSQDSSVHCMPSEV